MLSRTWILPPQWYSNISSKASAILIWFPITLIFLEWISNLISHFMVCVIIHPSWDQSKSMLVKGFLIYTYQVFKLSHLILHRLELCTVFTFYCVFMRCSLVKIFRWIIAMNNQIEHYVKRVYYTKYIQSLHLSIWLYPAVSDVTGWELVTSHHLLGHITYQERWNCCQWDWATPTPQTHFLLLDSDICFIDIYEIHKFRVAVAGLSKRI